MRVTKFKTPGGEYISINYSASTKMFSATYAGEKYERKTQGEIEDKLTELTTYGYEWQPVIEISVRRGRWADTSLEFGYDRYWVSPYFSTWKKSEWSEYSEKPGQERDYRDGSARHIRFTDNFCVPYHDPQRGTHIIPYNANLWENIMKIKSLITELADRLNDGFSDRQFLQRLRSSILMALPEGKED